MQLSDYEQFPAILPIVGEDELFFYPFMISPIFLTSQPDIDAATKAMEENSLLFVGDDKAGPGGGAQSRCRLSYRSGWKHYAQGSYA